MVPGDPLINRLKIALSWRVGEKVNTIFGGKKHFSCEFNGKNLPPALS
jgi:hypothetical protein